jgi:hypothetical protein
MLKRGPIEVEPCGAGHRVWVFGTVGYRVDPRRRAVIPYVREHGTPILLREEVELFRPLCTPYWLVLVQRALGLSPAGRQGDLFLGRKAARELETAIAESAWRRGAETRASACFASTACRARSRSTRISSPSPSPHAPGLIAASRTRASTASGETRSSTAARRARTRASCRWWTRRSKARCSSRARTRWPACGLKPATWRYVARHGARLFKCAWLARTRAPLRVAVDMMRTFEGAGLPPPPRGALARLLACYDGPPEVLGGILRFAHKVQGTPAHVPFLAEARLVLHWVRSELPELDKLQRRAGWPWLINRAQAWQKRREAALAAPRWRSALGEWSDGPYRAVPLDTVESMLDEAAAMRNCLAECIEHCQVGEERYFSVRALETGRRLAVVQLVFDRNAKFWRPGQVKGTCNKDVSATILAVAARLAAQYDEADGGPRQVAEPEWLAQLEEAVTAMTAGSPSEPAPGAP